MVYLSLQGLLVMQMLSVSRKWMPSNKEILANSQRVTFGETQKEAAKTETKTQPILHTKSVNPAKLNQLSWFKVVNIFWNHLKNNQNKEVGMAFAQKYGTNLLFPVIFSVPVVGWALGPLLAPFAGILSNKGENKLQKFIEDENYKQHPAVKAEHLINRWGEPESKLDTLVNGYNEFVEALFPEKAAPNTEPCKDSAILRTRFKVTKGSKGYQRIERLFNAKKALDKSMLRFLLMPMDAMYKFLGNFIKLPKALTGIFLIPRYALLGIFYMMGRKP